MDSGVHWKFCKSLYSATHGPMSPQVSSNSMFFSVFRHFHNLYFVLLLYVNIDIAVLEKHIGNSSIVDICISFVLNLTRFSCLICVIKVQMCKVILQHAVNEYIQFIYNCNNS